LGHPNAQVKFVQADAPTREKPAAPAPAAPVSASSSTSHPSHSSHPAAPEPARPDPEPARAKGNDLKNDPLIQKALEIFKGQIVEVRS